jgi:hypothetical protein
MLHVRDAWAMAVLALAACGTSARVCTAGVECASGVCRTDGTCAPVTGHTPAGADTDAVGDTDSAASGDAHATGGDSAPAGDTADGDAATVACVPNHDGTVTAAEVPLVLGGSLPLRLARDVAFATAGTVGEDGVRRWDFTVALTGDAAIERVVRAPDELWAPDTFPDATYALEVAGSDELLGVYGRTADAVLLQGLQSVADGLERTDLVYEPPLETLPLPLAESDTWETESASSGWALGYYSLYWESVTSAGVADLHGVAVLSIGDVPVQRVVTTLTRVQGLYVTVTKTYVFVAECLGVVAWVLGDAGDDAAELTHAAEVARLGR